MDWSRIGDRTSTVHQPEPTYRLEPTHNQRTTALVDALLLLRVERKWRALNRRDAHDACPEITRYRNAIRVLEADLLRAIISADECPAGASEATGVDPERTALLDDRAMAWRLARDLGFTLPRPSRPLLVKLRSERDFLATYAAGCRALSVERSARNRRCNRPAHRRCRTARTCGGRCGMQC